MKEKLAKTALFMASIFIMIGGSFVTDVILMDLPLVAYFLTSIMVISTAFVISLMTRTIRIGLFFQFFAIYVLFFLFIPFDQYQYGAEKIFLGFVIPIFSAVLLTLKRWNEESLIQSFLWTALFIVLYAIIYKAGPDFFVRTKKFGLVGSIPFGWVCAFAAILSILHKDLGQVLRLILVTIFFLAMLWSGSKGPLLAFFVIFGLVYIVEFKAGWRSIFIGFLAAGTLFLLLNYGEDLRVVKALNSLILSPETYIDGAGEGSIGSRLYYVVAAYDVFLRSPVLGVGLGGWSDAAHISAHKYPHNIYAEALSEIGFLGFLFLIMFLSYQAMLVYKRSHNFFWVYLLGLVVLTVSGDIGYLRYPLYFSTLVIFLYKNQGEWKIRYE